MEAQLGKETWMDGSMGGSVDIWLKGGIPLEVEITVDLGGAQMGGDPREHGGSR